MLKYIKHSDMLQSQQIIIREYVCTSLKLLNYLKKNTEFKILKIVPGVVGTPGMIFRILNSEFFK